MEWNGGSDATAGRGIFVCVVWILGKGMQCAPGLGVIEKASGVFDMKNVCLKVTAALSTSHSSSGHIYSRGISERPQEFP